MADLEQAIGITAKLYRARNAAKFLLGEAFLAEMAKWRDGIEKVAAARKVSHLQATILLSKQAGEDGNGVVQLLILAAYVEMTEPSVEVAA